MNKKLVARIILSAVLLVVIYIIHDMWRQLGTEQALEWKHVMYMMLWISLVVGATATVIKWAIENA